MAENDHPLEVFLPFQSPPHDRVSARLAVVASNRTQLA